MAEVVTQVQHDDEQLVIFTLEGESYGVAIGDVNTIIRPPEVTFVPHAPSYIRGVINLRGFIVPVVNLRRRFGLPEGEATKATRVVVVEFEGMLIGMEVDAVSETLHLTADAIEPLSPIVASVDAEYLRGVGKLGDRLIILLDLPRVLRHEEAAAMHALAAQEA
jgi:purine-binding chemotaxis protein CheW